MVKIKILALPRQALQQRVYTLLPLNTAGAGHYFLKPQHQPNSMTKIMNKPWSEFRSQLFDTMEKRRPKTETFRYEQMYFFIPHCRKLFDTPGTKEAEAALDVVRNEGTFLLVADALTEFLAMFPTSELEKANPESDAQFAESTDQSQQTDLEIIQTKLAQADLQGPRGSRTDQKPNQNPKPDARRNSGRPF
jgi:hypothetical protein